MLRVVRDAKPDLLVSTGDLVDGQINSLEKFFPSCRTSDRVWESMPLPGIMNFYAGISEAQKFAARRVCLLGMRG
jgi:hypothetical protein